MSVKSLSSESLSLEKLKQEKIASESSSLTTSNFARPTMAIIQNNNLVEKSSAISVKRESRKDLKMTS